ncbi:MAG: MFS transporter [Acidimicrobiia bacterium]
MSRPPNRGASRGQMTILVAEGFTARLGFGMVSLALPLYARRLGLSLASIALLMSINLTIAALLKPFMGFVADRLGHKRALQIAVAIRTVVAGSLIFAGSLAHLLLIRGAHGVAKALRDPAVNALIADRGGEKSIASTFAWYGTAKSTAGSVGKALAGVVLAAGGEPFGMVFGAAAVLSASGGAVVTALEPDRHRFSPTRAVEHHLAAVGMGPLLRRIAPYVGLGVLVSGTAQMLSGLLPVLAEEHAGLGTAEMGLVFLASSVAIVIAGPVFGWLADHGNHELVLLARGAANVMSSLVYLAVPTTTGIAAGKLTDDVGKAAFRPGWGLLMKRVSDADPARRGAVMGVMSASEDAGRVAAPILAAWIWTAWGVAAMLLIRAGLAAVSEIYTVVVMRGVERHPSPETARPRDPGGLRHELPVRTSR